MKNFRLSRGLCAAVGDVLSGSHETLNALFISSGAPGEPPDLAHHSKWKEWLFRAGQDENVDSLKVLGNILEEFMDAEPSFGSPSHEVWNIDRERILKALSADGLEYYRGGRVLPNGASSVEGSSNTFSNEKFIPTSVEDLLKIIVKGLRRAMFPLSNRRKGAASLSFSHEYDVQDLLHSMLRPWIEDVRAEEFTPSYAGTSTRMDFLLPAYDIVIETKIIRDRHHAKKVGDELIIDIAHYKTHPKCNHLWCVIYDPNNEIQNPKGMISDLEGEHTTSFGGVSVKIMVV